MKIVETNQGFCTVHSIESVIYKKNEEYDNWVISIIFLNGNGVLWYENTKEECEKKYNEILTAVMYCHENK